MNYCTSTVYCSCSNYELACHYKHYSISASPRSVPLPCSLGTLSEVVDRTFEHASTGTARVHLHVTRAPRLSCEHDTAHTCHVARPHVRTRLARGVRLASHSALASHPAPRRHPCVHSLPSVACPSQTDMPLSSVSRCCLLPGAYSTALCVSWDIHGDIMIIRLAARLFIGWSIPASSHPTPPEARLRRRRRTGRRRRRHLHLPSGSSAAWAVSHYS